MGYQALLFCPDEKTARTVTQVLSELEFSVEACTEPFAAVKKLMGQHFDAVVVDCDNEQNATLLFKSARNSTSNQASLAVAVVEGQAGVAKAFRIGANLVLTKPINVEQAKGTLRVARGLLRKGEPGKPASAAPAVPPAKPVASAKPVPPVKPAAPADAGLQSRFAFRPRRPKRSPPRLRHGPRLRQQATAPAANDDDLLDIGSRRRASGNALSKVTAFDSPGRSCPPAANAPFAQACQPHTAAEPPARPHRPVKFTILTSQKYRPHALPRPRRFSPTSRRKPPPASPPAMPGPHLHSLLAEPMSRKNRVSVLRSHRIEARIPLRGGVRACLPVERPAGRAGPEARQGDGRPPERLGLARLRPERVHGLPLARRPRPVRRLRGLSCCEELADYLTEHARRERYVLLTTPRVKLETDDDLDVGEFGIATRLVRGPRSRPPTRRRPQRRGRDDDLQGAEQPPSRPRTSDAAEDRGDAHDRRARSTSCRPPGRARPLEGLRHPPRRPERLAPSRRGPAGRRRLDGRRPRLDERDRGRRQAREGARARPTAPTSRSGSTEISFSQAAD